MNLPEGWGETILDAIGDWSTGGTPSRKRRDYYGDGIPWVKSGDLNDGILSSTDEQITKVGLDNSAAKIQQKGTLSIALYGATIGKISVFDIDAATNQACANCNVNSEVISTWFLFYFLMSQRGALVERGQGGAQPNISNSIVREWTISLPPLVEQKRIVAKVEELLTQVKAAKERLDKVPTILTRFRESVLAAACSGRLTEEWREGHTGIETGQQLLNRINPRRSQSSPELNYGPTEPPEIPSAWSWVDIKSICESERAITYGVIKLGPHVDGGIPVLRSSDVRWLRIDPNEYKCTSQEIADSYSRTYLKGGEVLVTVRGTLGGVAAAPPELAGHNISREVALLPVYGELNPKYLCYGIGWEWSQKWLAEKVRGVAYQGVNIRDLKELPIPLPPLEEQHEIVRRVETLFKLADAIEQRVETARAKVEKTTQSILAKAFRGRLVPTEAELARQEGRDYEPASVLLERIKAEREKAGEGKKKGRRGKV